IQKYADYTNAELPQEKPFSLFPLLDATATEEEVKAADWNYVSEVWSLMASFTKKTFGAYADLILGFGVWKYSPAEPVVEINWHEKPPCGEMYRKQFKELFQRDDRRGGASAHAGGGSPQGEERKPFSGEKRPFHDSQKNAKPVSPFAQTAGPYAQDKQNKFERPERPDKRNHFERPQKSSFKTPQKRRENGDEQGNASAQSTREQVDAALLEAKKAMETLSKDKKLHEISLVSQNSFIRREQHAYINDAGFPTESRGEQKERHVVVLNKK
ncbi:MAG: hypothetical protein K2X39_09975, partial [Silvanigrellaceae bacterium]|nr:hypothetical protein [Silvanigrellaceae bacterium]